MRLDPVFLVAPKTATTMPTRRAFLIAGSTFTFGTLVGGACGYSLGARAQPAPTPAEEELKPSGDLELDELRRLAVKAPIAELTAKRVSFTFAVSNVYRRDEVLWRGIERLCAEVVANEKFSDRRISAVLLAQVIEFADEPFQSRHASKAIELRRIK